MATKARDTKTHLDARSRLRVTPKEHPAKRTTSKEHSVMLATRTSSAARLA
eukprot:SAG11_NODE_880_length_6754_cov_29.319760_7_plen_51_part_00